MEPRPNFFGSFFRAVGDAVDNRGLVALVPYWLILGLAIGGGIAWFMPSRFWAADGWGVATTFYTGFLTFDGLLLAFGWGAFSKIYEIISQGWFAAFLRRNNLLSDHLLFIDLVHSILVLSALSSGAGLVTVLLPLPLWADQLILAVSVGLSFWALVKALSAMQMMNDLIWELAHSEVEASGHIKAVPSKPDNGSPR